MALAALAAQELVGKVTLGRLVHQARLLGKAAVEEVVVLLPAPVNLLLQTPVMED
jgi:hypothetical protein